MPYVKKPQSPLLRQFLLQKPRGMGQMGQTDGTVYSPTIDTSTIDTSGLNLSSITPTDLSFLNEPVSSPSSGGGVTTPVSTTTPSSTGLNLSNLLSTITNAAVAGQKIYLSSQAPSLVPGTNAIYNAATGQYYNPTTGHVVNANGTGVVGMPDLSSISAYLPTIMLYGGLALGAFLLIRMTGGK